MNKPAASALDEICADTEAIPPDVALELRQQVVNLRMWRDELMTTKPTRTQRVNALNAIAKLAEQMEQAVNDLGLEDQVALDAEFFEVPGDGVWFRALVEVLPVRALDLGGFVIPHVAQAARAAADRIPGASGPGREKMTDRQADLIRCIASAVKPAGMVPAHTGIFREVCEAVFAEAGMTFPERALRHFMQHLRPRYQAGGWCL